MCSNLSEGGELSHGKCTALLTMRLLLDKDAQNILIGPSKGTTKVTVYIEML